jgi:hypothetical protein
MLDAQPSFDSMHFDTQASQSSLSATSTATAPLANTTPRKPRGPKSPQRSTLFSFDGNDATWQVDDDDDSEDSTAEDVGYYDVPVSPPKHLSTSRTPLASSTLATTKPSSTTSLAKPATTHEAKPLKRNSIQQTNQLVEESQIVSTSAITWQFHLIG